jgi:hypothetical protein
MVKQWLEGKFTRNYCEVLPTCGFQHLMEEDNEYEEEKGLPEVIFSLPLHIQQDVVSFSEMENANAALVFHEEVPATAEDILD